MQSLPQTPSKADDGIRKVKQKLSAKWNIQLPERGSIWSPSSRDYNHEEEKINTFIQFLYFRPGALDLAISNFERNAASIHSEWHFKPKAEADVIPHRELSRRGSGTTFLKKRDDVPESATNDLMRSLHHHLSMIVYRVKQGENFHEVQDDPDFPSQSVEEYPLLQAVKSQKQTPLARWFRNKSAPEASTKAESAQQPSSDDYPDSEMVDLLSDGTIMNLPDAPTMAHVLGDTSPDKDSCMDEKFVTPPTTPLWSRQPEAGLGIRLDEQSRVQDHFQPTSDARPPDGTTHTSKKRSLPEAEAMRPPPIRKVSREKNSAQGEYNYAAPTPHPDPHYFWSRSFTSSRSTDMVPSMTSSFSGTSPTWTSPNTSFCSDSAATSFDSAADETDTTIKPTAPVRPDRRRGQPPTEPKIQSYPQRGDQTTSIKDTTTLVPDPSIAAKPDINPRLDLQSRFRERLETYSPFGPTSDEFMKRPFRQLYEVTRVSTSCNVPLSYLSNCLIQDFDDYAQLWNTLGSTVAKMRVNSLPEKSSLSAWRKAGEDSKGVGFYGKLTFCGKTSGPVFEFSLLPLKLDSSYRLARKYGHDRFCTILIPSLDGLPAYLKSLSTEAHSIIIKWLVETEHHFLGRVWRAYFVKPEPTKKSQKRVKSDTGDARYRIHLFAEDGENFGPKIKDRETDARSIHGCVTVHEMVEWFMSSKENPNQTVLKFFNRLGMGLTSTIPTFEFRAHEVIRSNDAYADAPSERHLDFRRSEDIKRGLNPHMSDAPVMNDGCARISRDAATAIANMLGMDQAPSVFQGRVGGAKGVWMTDALDERPPRCTRGDGRAYWIEVTDSQLKFKPHPIDNLYPDPARSTFEVNKYSKKLAPSSLSFQLIPILENRGVPQEVFKQRLREDLSSRVSEMEVAMDDGLALRKWIQDTDPVTQARAQYGGIEMVGGLPESNSEKINWFVEHGFEPKTCRFLKDQLWKAIRTYCFRLENRMHIALGRSTNAFMIADPLAVLDEGEIHIGFSGVFRDAKSAFSDSMLHNIDVLVARNPAHLPSDIQKVRAVFKPELRIYRDVVVFSSKGDVSLASKLSGGDYDGDRAWICWDPEIVDPFQNAQVPQPLSHETFGIEKDETKVSQLLGSEQYMNQFLTHAFEFNLQMNMLGICSNYHESLCYHMGSIDSYQAVNVGLLLGNLVDSAKAGFKFDGTKWTAYLDQLGLPQSFERPAFKDKKRSRKKKDNLIDELVFSVAKEEREKALKQFTLHFKDVISWDEDLVRPRSQELKEAGANPTLENVLKHLKDGLERIIAFWRDNAKREDDDEGFPIARKANLMSFNAVVEKCRQDFVALRPIVDESIAVTCPDTIRRWQDDHSSGRSSHWDLLKASVAFYHYHESVSFIWHIAGIELGHIKVSKGGRGTYRSVVNPIFETLKLDNKLVEGAKRRETQMEELRRLEYDDDDEFGSDIDWMDL